MTKANLMPMSEVLEHIPVHRTTIINMVERGEFPPPVFIGRRRFWPAAVVASWLDRKIKGAA